MYKEQQQFNQWWLWLLLLSTTVILGYGIVKQVIMDEPFGVKATSDSGLLAIGALMVGIIVLFSILRLDTEIDEKQIRIRFFPVLKRVVNWEDIESTQVIKYGFVGGWGIRIGTRYGTVYSTRGNKGLAVKLKSGKKFLIGTQKTEELERFIQNLGQERTS